MLRRHRFLRLALLLPAVLISLVAGAAPASAHSVGGSEAVNFSTRVLRVSPAVPGVVVRPVEAGARLELVNTSGRDIIVLGYDNEPYLRVGPGGVFENQSSPATYANRAALGAPVPSTANAKAAPAWKKVADGDRASWHDHRAHWMSTDPPPAVQADPGQERVINPSWSVPLRDGDTTITVTGDLRWVPGPSPAPWIILAVVLGLAALVAGRLRTWPTLLAVLLGALLIVDIVHTAGSWSALRVPVAEKAYGSLIGVAGWAVGAVAIWQFGRGRAESGLFYLIFSAGLITVIGGLSDVSTLSRSQLVSDLPEWLTRASVAVKLGLGLGLSIAGLLRLRAAPETPAEPQPEAPAKPGT